MTTEATASEQEEPPEVQTETSNTVEEPTNEDVAGKEDEADEGI